MATGDFTKVNCGKNFVGCFAMDEIAEKVPRKQGAYVVNTDDRDERGVHWICCCFGDDATVYLDSYGAPPPQRMADFMKRGGNPVLYNGIQIQSLESDVCGQHCCALLKKLSKKRDVIRAFNEHVYNFDLDDLDKNDATVGAVPPTPRRR